MAKRASRAITRKTKATSRTDKSKVAGTNQCIASVKLAAFRVVESHCVLRMLDAELLTEISVNVSTGVQLDANQAEFTVRILTSVDTTSHPPSGKDGSHLTINAKVECVYVSLTKPSDEDMSTLSLMGTMTAWPTLRDTVSSLSARTGQQPILLPILYLDPATGTPSFTVSPPVDR